VLWKCIGNWFSVANVSKLHQADMYVYWCLHTHLQLQQSSNALASAELTISKLQAELSKRWVDSLDHPMAPLHLPWDVSYLRKAESQLAAFQFAPFLLFTKQTPRTHAGLGSKNSLSSGHGRRLCSSWWMCR
jgi:hypothetical protein